MTQEALKLALEELANRFSEGWHEGIKIDASDIMLLSEAAEALAQPEQEPVAWQTMEAKYPTLEKLDIRMGDGSILCSVWPQSDGDLWWEGSGTGEKFIDPKYANVTHWRVHSDTNPPQRTWVGLTDEEIAQGWKESWVTEQAWQSAVWWAEDKLKQKNHVAQETN